MFDFLTSGQDIQRYILAVASLPGRLLPTLSTGEGLLGQTSGGKFRTLGETLHLTNEERLRLRFQSHFENE